MNLPTPLEKLLGYLLYLAVLAALYGLLWWLLLSERSHA